MYLLAKHKGQINWSIRLNCEGTHNVHNLVNYSSLNSQNPTTTDIICFKGSWTEAYGIFSTKIFCNYTKLKREQPHFIKMDNLLPESYLTH
jgi:hypothetical protein